MTHQAADCRVGLWSRPRLGGAQGTVDIGGRSRQFGDDRVSGVSPTMPTLPWARAAGVRLNVRGDLAHASPGTREPACLARGHIGDCMAPADAPARPGAQALRDAFRTGRRVWFVRAGAGCNAPSRLIQQLGETGMELAYKPDLEAVADRWETFWRGESRRPLISAVIPKAGKVPAEKPGYASGVDGNYKPVIEQLLRWAEEENPVHG